MRRTLIGMLAATSLLYATSTADAADRIYWTNINNGTISYANLDGSGGGGQLDTTGATAPSLPGAVGIDAANGRLYWADQGSHKVSYANLAGGSGGDVDNTGTTVGSPRGGDIDVTGGRFYWADELTDEISYVNLTGGGDDLDVAGSATAPNNPNGVAVDPANNKVFWAGGGTNNVSFTNRDDTGSSGNLDTTGAPALSGPLGVSLDAAANRLYWFSGNSLSYTNANNTASGGGLTIGVGTATGPRGTAVDNAGGKFYWANLGSDLNPLSFANLDDSGGAALGFGGATPSGAIAVAILKHPAGTAAPVASGGSTTGSELSCTQGSWVADPTGSHVSLAPQSFAYEWELNGSPIGGATSGTYTASAAGNYTCTVTATNAAGSTGQTSAVHSVSSPPATNPTNPTNPAPPSNSITLGKLALNKKKGTGTLTVDVPADGELTIGGKDVSASKIVKKGKVKVTVRAKGKAKKALNKKGKVTLTVKITFKPTGGTAKTQTKKVKLVKRR